MLNIFNSFQKALQIPVRIAFSTSHKIAKHSYELKARSRRQQQELNQETVLKWKESVQELYESKSSVTCSSENELVRKIKQKTNEHNRNNVTRTAAYLAFYHDHPEVHWALLAHLVSRNGGWNMTDLKGSLLENIFTTKAKKDFFMFLECANAFIFHDAYPQLLLYEQSKEKQRNHFHLLPEFGVSIFMKPVWDSFLEHQDSQLLTIALIINEQHYIEQRIVSNEYYKENVFESSLFEMQELFHFTNVIFPYKLRKKRTKLIGLNVSHFAPVEKRIELGKRLYVMLFEIQFIFEDIMLFVDDTPHTGSRSDYWPQTFSAEKNNGSRLKEISLTSESSQPTIFSPPLEGTWEDVSHKFIDEDWYQTKEVFQFFSQVKPPRK